MQPIFTSPAGTGNLELIEGDLLQPGSFDDAFKGCKYIFHTASPFFIEATDPQKELVDVAVLGTRNVMQSAAKAAPSGLSRIVLTSSCAAVKGFKTPAQPSNGSTYSERDWNEVSTVANGEAYWASKTLAERAAWDLAKEMDLDLVTILPEFIMGPVISSRTDGTSVGYMKQWVEGKVLSGAPVFADVRDVARAHILAAETPSAQGRYIVAAAESTPPQVISAWLKERFPDGSFEDVADDQHEESKVVIDNGRVQKELGLVLTPVKSTIIDMAVTLVQLGIAKET